MDANTAIESTKQPKDNHYMDCLTSAYVYLKYLQKGQTFTSEQLKEQHAAFMSYGFALEPAEPRVWGAVIRQLQKDGRIEHSGFDRYKNPAGHGKPVNVWRVK